MCTKKNREPGLRVIWIDRECQQSYLEIDVTNTQLMLRFERQKPIQSKLLMVFFHCLLKFPVLGLQDPTESVVVEWSSSPHNQLGTSIRIRINHYQRVPASISISCRRTSTSKRLKPAVSITENTQLLTADRFSMPWRWPAPYADNPERAAAPNPRSWEGRTPGNVWTFPGRWRGLKRQLNRWLFKENLGAFKQRTWVWSNKCGEFTLMWVKSLENREVHQQKPWV